MLHRDVAQGIHRIENAYTNFYLVEDDDGITVVDAGLPASWGSLLSALRDLDLRVQDVRAVILTHGHLDHTGFAERARTELGIPVHVHEEDVRLTEKPLRFRSERSPFRYAFKPSALAALGSFILHRAFLPVPLKEVQTFSEGQLQVPGSPSIVRSQGHTWGHCAFHFHDRDALIAGDSIVTLDPYTGRTGPRLMARASMTDSEQAYRSLDALASTGARTVLPGHGEPWLEGVEAAVTHARAAGIG